LPPVLDAKSTLARLRPISAVQLVGAMMVEWLGRRRGQRAGGLIRDAVDAALTRGVRPYEVAAAVAPAPSLRRCWGSFSARC